MKKQLTIAAFALAMTASGWAQVNGYYAAGNSLDFTNVLSAGGGSLGLGNVVAYGNFNGAYSDTDLQNFLSGGLTPAELASINGAFDPLFLWDIGDGTGAAGTFEVTPTTNNATATPFADERMYMLIYNVSDFANADLATEFGVLRNDFDLGTGGRFGTPGAFPISSEGIVFPDNQTALIGSYVSGGFQLASVVIPEPGTWAMLLIGLGMVAWRARRKR